jgi:hypothetical protein
LAFLYCFFWLSESSLLCGSLNDPFDAAILLQHLLVMAAALNSASCLDGLAQLLLNSTFFLFFE